MIPAPAARHGLTTHCPQKDTGGAVTPAAWTMGWGDTRVQGHRVGRWEGGTLCYKPLHVLGLSRNITHLLGGMPLHRRERRSAAKPSPSDSFEEHLAVRDSQTSYDDKPG